MRTTEERMSLIHKRTAELRQKKQKRQQRRLDAACIAACLILIAGIGAVMPGMISGTAAGSVIYTEGTASLVENHAALGYIIMGLMAFLLGVCVTVLLYRLRLRNKEKPREDD